MNARRHPARSLCHGHSAVAGFTFVEIVVALTLLGIAFLGMGTVVPSLVNSTSRARTDFLTLNAVEDRLETVLMDPRYELLDSIYAEAAVPVDHLQGALRTTTVSRTETDVPDARILDFTTVRVTVVSERPSRTVSRSITVGKP